MKPNVLIHGVGHSGTRLFVEMARAMGWNVGKVKPTTKEHAQFNRINKLLAKGKDCSDLQRAMFDKLTSPWAIKCTRSIVALPKWLPYFANYQPLMLYVTRHPDAMAKTYRGDITARKSQGRLVSELCEMAAQQYEAWPWGKVHLEYEQVVRWALQWYGGNHSKVREEVAAALPCVTGDIQPAVECVNLARARKSLEAIQ